MAKYDQPNPWRYFHMGLELAIAASQAIGESASAGDVPAQVQARAMYNEAVAMYQLDPRQARQRGGCGCGGPAGTGARSRSGLRQ